VLAGVASEAERSRLPKFLGVGGTCEDSGCAEPSSSRSGDSSIFERAAARLATE
jgi:hypothetical protein